MRKLLVAAGVSLMAGSLWAACVGPYCWDDAGASVNANLQLQGPPGLPNDSAANIRAKTPKQKGELYYCTDCNQISGGFVCVSTGTTAGSFSLLLTTSTRCQ